MPAVVLLLLFSVSPTSAQDRTATPEQGQEKPAADGRAGVGMVPTDVLILDRQGRAVGNLKQDQFELLVDGKAQPISVFSEVLSGSPEESDQWARAHGWQSSSATPETQGHVGGRRIFIFLDDLHMSVGSLKRVRAALLHYIDTGMGPHDRVGIVAATRQIGILHQLTDDKASLRSAVEQIKDRALANKDETSPPMSEAEAVAISQNDPEVMSSFVAATLQEKPEMKKLLRRQVENMLRTRATNLLRQSVAGTDLTLASLSELLQTQAAMPGRKFTLVLSDGFVLQAGRENHTDRVLQLTDAAARAATAIYTVETRLPETGRTKADAEASDLQDGLGVLAAETGGRRFRFSDDLDDAISRILSETSPYSLLGWSLQPWMLQAGSTRSVKVSIKGRPDLAVRLRQSSVDLSRYVWREIAGVNDPRPDDLMAAIRSSTPPTALPVFFYPAYSYQEGKGQLLQILIQVEDDATAAAGLKEAMPVDIAGVVISKDGVTEDYFRSSLVFPAKSDAAAKEQQAGLMRSRTVALSPGLYQIRIAARNMSNGRTGVTEGWIDIPPFSPDKLSLSSMYLAEQQDREAQGQKPAAEPRAELPPSVTRRFSATSSISFSMLIYNAAVSAAGAAPNLTIQAKIRRGEQITIQTPSQPLNVKAGTGVGPISYTGSLSLRQLVAGSYTLEVAVTDHSNNSTATQRASFWVK